MGHHDSINRPQPRFENGCFIPSVPVPDPRDSKDYKWYHAFATIPTIMRNPLESFNHSQFKDPVSQYKLLINNFSVINDPAIIKHCFVDNRDNYKFSSVRQRMLRTILGDGLITAEGEKWRHARHAMAPMFTPRNVKSFAAIMKATTEREMSDLFQTGRTLKISKAMSALTYLVLSDTLFSGDIDRDKNQVLKDVATALLYVARLDPLDILNAPSWMPRLTRIRGLKSVANLRAMISEVLVKRKAVRQTNDGAPDDFMNRLMNVGRNDDNVRSFTDTEIEDHLLSFIGAGHETTARALSWLFYLLSNDTKSRDRFEAEVDALDTENIPPEMWGEHLPFVMACFEETMRLFPPAPFIVRQVIDEDKIEGITLASNSILFVNTWQLHRHHKLWDDPDSFKPERFLGANRDTIDRFQYLPFGLGERVCIGQRFAMQEAAILMALLAKNYRFNYESTDVPWPKLNITVHPENEMPMTVTRRAL